MKIDKSKYSSKGVGLGIVLFLIFSVLKLTDLIDWSWWWVTLPLWGGATLLLSTVVLILLVGFIVIVIKNLIKKQKR